MIDPTGTGDFFTPNGERTVSGAFAQLKARHRTWLEVIGAAPLRPLRTRLAALVVAAPATASPRKLTVGVTPISWFTVYGTYAEGYRAPALTEVFVSGTHPQLGPARLFCCQNLGLKPEVGKTKEIGVNFRYDNLFVANDALRIKANVFQNDLTDFIEQTSAQRQNDPVQGGGTVPRCSASAAVSEHSVRAHPRGRVRKQLRRRHMVHGGGGLAPGGR